MLLFFIVKKYGYHSFFNGNHRSKKMAKKTKVKFTRVGTKFNDKDLILFNDFIKKRKINQSLFIKNLINDEMRRVSFFREVYLEIKKTYTDSYDYLFIAFFLYILFSFLAFNAAILVFIFSLIF